MVRLRCTHCKYEYDVSEDEFRENGELHRYCFICGGVIEVANLGEIIQKDLDTEVRENISLWFRELGIEYTIEMVSRHSNEAIARLYIEEIRRRGFKI